MDLQGKARSTLGAGSTGCGGGGSVLVYFASSGDVSGDRREGDRPAGRTGESTLSEGSQL